MPDDRARTLLLYLRRYGDRYSLDALRRQMAADGHSEAEIEAAIEDWQAEKSGSKPVWKLAVPVALLNLLLTAVVIWSILNEIGSTPGTPGAVLAATLWSTLLVEFVGGLILMFFPRRRRLALGLLFGFLLYLGLGVLSAGGFCLFLMAQS